MVMNGPIQPKVQTHLLDRAELRRLAMQSAFWGELTEDAVKRASARAAADGLSGCRFSVADVAAFETDQRFDAVVGRLVLMYVNDPARTPRSLVRHLTPGGIVAFHEIVL